MVFRDFGGPRDGFWEFLGVLRLFWGYFGVFLEYF